MPAVDPYVRNPGLAELAASKGLAVTVSGPPVRAAAAAAATARGGGGGGAAAGATATDVVHPSFPAAAPQAMPFLTFDNDTPFARPMGERFVTGTWLMPRANSLQLADGRAAAACAAASRAPADLTLSLSLLAWVACGVWAHPHHNWYVSAAHSMGDIERALVSAEAAMEEVAAM